MKDANESIKELTDRLCEMYREREDQEKSWDSAFQDAMIYGMGQVKLYPDKTHGVRVKYLPRKPKKWWQWWG